MSGSHWEIIGFQGSAPDRDIRYGGVANLLHMLHFISFHLEIAKDMQMLSNEEQQDFPFMCTSFQMSKIVLDVTFPPASDDLSNTADTVADPWVGARTKLLKYINSNSGAYPNALLKLTCRFHNALLHYFYKKWLEKKLSIRHYGTLMKEIEEKIKKQGPVAMIDEFDAALVEKKEINNPESLEFTDLEAMQQQAAMNARSGGGGGNGGASKMGKYAALD